MDEIRCDFRIKKSSNLELQSLYDAREIAINLGLDKQRKAIEKKITTFKAIQFNKRKAERRNEFKAF